MKIIIFQSSIIKIGGVETFTYNLSKQLSKYYDVLVLYINCDIGQLDRISQNCRIEKYNKNKEYICDICICASSWSGYPDSVISTKNEYWQMIHANYKELAKTGYTYKKWNKTTKHIAVSNAVRDIFNELYHENAITLYNILDDIKNSEPVLKLISATRLSGEKGYNRMIKLANELKKNNKKFIWLIFTDLVQYNVSKINIEGIIYMKPSYDIFDYIKWADYGVQLSDTEGYSYFVNECLQYGTPMITTNFDSVYESVEDGVNGYILDMDLSNLDLDKIINKKPKDFKYIPKTTINDWIKLIGKPSKKEKYEYNKVGTKVRSLVNIYYVDEDIHANKGTEFTINNIERINSLLEKGYIEVIE